MIWDFGESYLWSRWNFMYVHNRQYWLEILKLLALLYNIPIHIFSFYAVKIKCGMINWKFTATTITFYYSIASSYIILLPHLIFKGFLLRYHFLSFLRLKTKSDKYKFVQVQAFLWFITKAVHSTATHHCKYVSCSYCQKNWIVIKSNRAFKLLCLFSTYLLFSFLLLIQILPDIRNESAALKEMPKGYLEYLRRVEPYLRNQSEDCLYLNVYSSIGNQQSIHLLLNYDLIINITIHIFFMCLKTFPIQNCFFSPLLLMHLSCLLECAFNHVYIRISTWNTINKLKKTLFAHLSLVYQQKAMIVNAAKRRYCSAR